MAASSMEQMLLRGQGPKEGASAGLLTAFEAERMVERLRPMGIEEVGSAKFLEQHDCLEKLNLQAHHNAQTHSDEFVMAQLVSHDKLPVLVHNLLAIEAWKSHVLPLLEDHLALEVDGVTSYLCVYSEAALANLLEVLLFHVGACEALGEEVLVELVDWAYRKVAWLAGGGGADAARGPPERTAAQLLAQAPREELADKAAEVEWGVALCGLTVLRYLTDHVAALPLGLMSRLVGANDTIMALLPLVERPPWVRTRKGKMERFEGGRWQAVAPANRLKLGQHDAQVWLALTNLVVDPRCRAKYDPDEHRKEALHRLRRHLNELLLDQLPVLRDLQRCLDEMALGADTGASDQGKAARLVIEQVPVMREGILRAAGGGWAAVAERQKRGVFGKDARHLARERMDSMLQAFEYLARMEGEQEEEGGQGGSSAGGQAGAAAGPSGRSAAGGSSAALDPTSQPVKVSCLRQVRGSVHEHWCDLELRVDGSRPAEAMEVVAEDGSRVAGRRWRLQPLDPSASRPLAATGKVVVRHGGRCAEALLQLPTIPVRTVDQGPPGLWLTVGLLAADGLAVQLRLRKADKALERDRVEGVWYAYQVVGGAITLLEEEGGAPAAAG